MSYEIEQKEYEKQLIDVNKQYDILKKYFEENPEKKKREIKWKQIGEYYHMNPLDPYQDDHTERFFLEKILREQYEYYSCSDKSNLYLKFIILGYKKSFLERKLKETKTQRNIGKVSDYIDGITPRHVYGRVYEVKDGDGCATFCLWFGIIDFIVIGILYLCGVFN